MPDQKIEIRDSKGKHIKTYYRSTDEVIIPPAKLTWKFFAVVGFLIVVGIIAGPMQNYRAPNQGYNSASTNDVTDLSETYGIVHGTIFNKKTHVVFQKPEEFFADSGRNSFDGLKLDTGARIPADARYVNGQRVKRR